MCHIRCRKQMRSMARTEEKALKFSKVILSVCCEVRIIKFQCSHTQNLKIVSHISTNTCKIRMCHLFGSERTKPKKKNATQLEHFSKIITFRSLERPIHEIYNILHNKLSMSICVYAKIAFSIYFSFFFYFLLLLLFRSHLAHLQLIYIHHTIHTHEWICFLFIS